MSSTLTFTIISKARRARKTVRWKLYHVFKLGLLKSSLVSYRDALFSTPSLSYVVGWLLNEVGLMPDFDATTLFSLCRFWVEQV